MKKLLISTLAVLAAFAVHAQNGYTRSFMTVPCIILTNGFQVTNLLTVSSVGTNSVGTSYTNNLGTRYAVGGTNDASLNLFKDIPLYADRNGNIPGAFAPGLSATPFTNNFGGNINLNIKLKGGANANSAVSFKIVPLPNGSDESTASGDSWVVSVTASGATVVDNMFTVPLWQWPGVQKIRLIYAVNADTDASSEVYLLDASVNGFQP